MNQRPYNRPISVGVFQILALVTVLTAIAPGRSQAQSLLGGWTFDSTPGAPSTPNAVTSNLGLFTGALFANGQVGSSTWLSNELDALAGTTLSDPRSSPVAGRAYTLKGQVAGKSIVFGVPITGYQGMTARYDVRADSNGFPQYDWAFSLDGASYSNLAAFITNTSGSYIPQSLDLSSIAAVNTAGSTNDTAILYLRLRVFGPTTVLSNVSVDNFQMVSANFTWFGGTTIYNDGSNWQQPGLNSAFGNAPTTGANINFQGTPATTPTFPASTSVGTITFNAGTSPLTLTGSVTVNTGIDNRSTSLQAIANAMTLGGPVTFNARSGDLRFDGAIDNGANTLTVTGAGNTTITRAFTGSGGLTKSGAGTLNLSNASGNAYTGPTVVNGGMLLVNNTSPGTTGTGSNSVTANSGGTIGGSGRIGGAMTINSGGHVAPGNSPGTLTISGVVALMAGSNWDIEVGAAGLSDRMDMSSTFRIFDGALVNVSGVRETTMQTYVVSSLTTGENIFRGNDVAPVPDGFVFGSLTVGGAAAGPVVTINAATFTSGDVFSLQRQGNNVVLLFTPIPEPMAVLVVLLAGVGAYAWRWPSRPIGRASAL